jgi:hypothetical protein
MALSRREQEVVISFDAEEDVAEIYISDPVWMRKLDKLVEQNPEQFIPGKVECAEGKVIAKRYTFPKGLITIRTRAKVSTMTEEQRRAASERMKARRINSTAKN